MKLPDELNKMIVKGTKSIIDDLGRRGWKEEGLPHIEKKGFAEGEALVEGYAILGVEKYLGVIDKKERLAYFPSVSLTNDSTVARTYVRFDPNVSEDIVYIGENEVSGREKERVLQTIDRFRGITGIQSKVIYVSRNEFKGGSYGKGLGTSAAAGAALAAALVYGGTPEYSENKRFIANIARILAGSATRSVAGGFAVWPSNIEYTNRPDDSYGIRIDNNDIDTKLVVVPIAQSAKTEEAHDAAVKSPYYQEWAKLKVENVPRLVKAIFDRDLDQIGVHAENDSIWLNKIITSGGGVNNWEPDTVALKNYVVELRKSGLHCYYSIDTGPSVAIITKSSDATKVKSAIESEYEKFKNKVFICDVAGSPTTLQLNRKNELVTDAINELLAEKGIDIN